MHRTLIQPALLEAGLTGSTTGEIIDAGNVREDMFSLILGADLVVADISLHNANVFTSSACVMPFADDTPC